MRSKKRTLGAVLVMGLSLNRALETVHVPSCRGSVRVQIDASGAAILIGPRQCRKSFDTDLFSAFGRGNTRHFQNVFDVGAQTF